MTERISLFKSLLNKGFWNENKHRISKELFSDLLEDLFESLVIAHDTITGDVSCRDLYDMHLSLSPTLTKSNKDVIIDIVRRINEAEELSAEAAQFILSKALVELKADQIAQCALEISQGKHEDWDKLQRLLNTSVVAAETPMVTTDVQELITDLDNGYRFRYNLTDLDRELGPVGPGMLNILAGPVNAGKSALAISFVAAPKGFLEQQADVLYICNEERHKKIMLRMVSCYTGLTKEEIQADPKTAQAIWDKVRQHLWMLGDYDMTFNKLNGLLQKKHPDIVVLDMLDKVGVGKSFAREDQRLGYIYESARESAKRYDTCVFGLSQTDAKSFGKLYYSFDRLHASKVEKGANADTVITIGAQSGDFNTDADNNFRVLNIAKSKNEGSGHRVQCQIKPVLSRFIP
jgi:archaellum biogenesis ATPase FlaH